MFHKILNSLNRKQIILSGLETHVCIYQTCADLLDGGYAVQVTADAVSSRAPENKEIALRRLAAMGIGITSTEMIVMELIRNAEHPRFRDVLKLIK